MRHPSEAHTDRARPSRQSSYDPRSKAHNISHRLAILGSYPPPNTGVTLHVARLCALLERRGVDYVVYNATSAAGDGERVISVQRRRQLWLLRYLIGAREPAVYILSGRLSAWIIGALLAVLRGKRVMLRLRNDALIAWTVQSRWRRFWCRFALRRMYAVVCVNAELAAAAVALGVKRERLHHLPGFLPPIEDPADRTGVAPAVWSFVDTHEPIVATNGKVNWHCGEDLYGFDQFVELLARLKSDFPKIGGVICFADHRPADEAYVDTLRESARAHGVTDQVLFNTQAGPFLPVLAASDVFVRPTNTDGDANSLREALALGVPTVASDVVARPEGALLFRTRDLDDFESATRRALATAATRAHTTTLRLSDADRRNAEAYVELLAEAAAGRAAQPATRAEVSR